MEKNIYIEPETMNAAQRNYKKALDESCAIIENGTPEEVRAAVCKVREAGATYRAFLRANYKL